jgi:plasmid stabilization system protein ParE
LAELVSYIAADNPKAAYRLHDEIRKQTGILAAHPEAGRLGRVAGTRELVIAGTPYIAAYRVTREVVTILRLLHGARRWPRAL